MLVLVAVALIAKPAYASTTIIFIGAGTSFTVPSDFLSLISVEAIGAGGDGGNTGTDSGGAGGGGGAYAKITSLTGIAAGNSYTIHIGAHGGTTGSGTTPTANTWFKDSSTLVAAGGATGANGSGADATGGAGGSTANSIGAVKNAGGNGGNHIHQANGGGGGGGAAGPNGVGNNGSNSSAAFSNTGGNGGSGDAGFGGAGGAHGAHNGSAGTEGSGGGGGGADFGTSGGAGGDHGGGGGGATSSAHPAGNNGLIIFSYTPVAATCTLSASPTLILSGGSSTLTWTSSNASSVGIDNGVGTVTPTAGGTKSVSPSVTTTYTMTATGSGGNGTCTATVTLAPTPLVTLPNSGTINGNATVVAGLAKGSGTFAIDDPLDPANKILFHSFVESPEALDFYDGIATLDKNGKATVGLPDYFLALNTDYQYLLTAIGQPMPNKYIAQGVHRRYFFGLFGPPVFDIAGGAPNGRISWQVTGIRHDPYILAHPIVPEVEKGPDQIVDVGKYLFPQFYEKK